MFGPRGWDPATPGEPLPRRVVEEFGPRGGGAPGTAGRGFRTGRRGPAGTGVAADPLRPGRGDTRLDWYNEGLDVTLAAGPTDFRIPGLLEEDEGATGTGRLRGGARVGYAAADHLPAHLRSINWRYPRPELLYPTFQRNTLDAGRQFDGVWADFRELYDFGVKRDRVRPPGPLSVASYCLLAAWYQLVPFPVAFLLNKVVLPIRCVTQALHKQLVLACARLDLWASRTCGDPALWSLQRTMQSYHGSLSLAERMRVMRHTLTAVWAAVWAEGGIPRGGAGAPDLRQRTSSMLSKFG